MARSLKKRKTGKNTILRNYEVSGINELRNKSEFVLPEFIYRFVSPERIKDIVFDSGVRIEHKRD